jgi:hypothetical protein
VAGLGSFHLQFESDIKAYLNLNWSHHQMSSPLKFSVQMPSPEHQGPRVELGTVHSFFFLFI